MATPKTEVQTAWEQFHADMKSLGDELRRHHEQASTEDPALQESLNKLDQAADQIQSGGEREFEVGVESQAEPEVPSGPGL
jgi:hypothetical protein